MTTHAALPPLAELSLSRSTVDRDAERRADDGLLDRLLADPATRVLVLDGDRGLVMAGPDGADRVNAVAGTDGTDGTDGTEGTDGTDGAEGPVLALLDPDAARAAVAALGLDPAAGVTAAYLGSDTVAAGSAAQGRGADGPGAGGSVAGAAGAPSGYVLLAVPRTPSPLSGGPAAPAPPERPAPGGTRWAGLREVGSLLDATGSGLLVSGVALSNWHSTHPRCARCGEPTRVAMSGWARRCEVCGAEHYPRTDPAVIMAVVDDQDRILLGRQQVWPPKRYSTLAGFVEPGESLEAAVRREVFEESGVRVGAVTYQGSQPWPFPSSLMLGFSAAATSTDVRVDGEELAHARWWSREQLTEDVASGELLLPPGVSIARRLIEQWYGGPLTDAQEAWR